MITRILCASMLALSLTACSLDNIIQDSRFNQAPDQVATLKAANIYSGDALSINPAQYVEAQIMEMHRKIYDMKKVGPAPNSISNLISTCGIRATSDLLKSHASILNDKVIGVSLATATLDTQNSSYLAAYGQDKDKGNLTYADFEAFRLLLTDAHSDSNLGNRPEFHNAKRAVSSQIKVANLILSSEADKKQNPYLAYLGPYYRGKFIDRFGKPVEKPSLKNGIDDGTISAFARVFLEATIDLAESRQPIVVKVDGAGKVTEFYPDNKKPTFHDVYPEAIEPVKDKGKDGISAAEAKLIEVGANLIADQGLTLFSGFFEFLDSIDIGFVVTPSFSVGSNGTLKALARTTIETSIRRGAERGMYCLVKANDLDAVAKIVGD